MLGLQVFYYYAVKYAWLLPVQDVKETTFTSNELRQLQFGTMPKNMINFIRVGRLNTRDWLKSKNGWCLYDNERYLAREFPECRLFNVVHDYLPAKANKSNETILQKFPRLQQRYGCASWAEWSIANYVSTTQTIEIRNTEAPAEGGVCNATQIFQLFGITDPKSASKVSHATIAKKKEEQAVEADKVDKDKTRLIKKLQKLLDGSLPQFKFTDTQCLEIFDCANVCELDSIKLKKIMSAKIMKSCINIDMNAWDCLVLKHVNYRDEARLWPEGDLQMETIENWGNWAVTADKITEEASIEFIDKELADLEKILWIIALYYMYIGIQVGGDEAAQNQLHKEKRKIIANLWFVYTQLLAINSFFKTKIKQFLTNSDWIGYAMFNIKYMVYQDKKNSSFIYNNTKWFNMIKDNFASNTPAGQKVILDKIEQPERYDRYYGGEPNGFVTVLTSHGLTELLCSKYMYELVEMWQKDNAVSGSLAKTWHLSGDWNAKWKSTSDKIVEEKREIEKKEEEKKKNKQSKQKKRKDDKDKEKEKEQDAPPKKKRRLSRNTVIKEENKSDDDDDDDDDDMTNNYTSLSVLKFIEKNVPKEIFKDDEIGKNSMIDALKIQLQKVFVFQERSTLQLPTLTNEKYNLSGNDSEDIDQNSSNKKNGNLLSPVESGDDDIDGDAGDDNDNDNDNNDNKASGGEETNDNSDDGDIESGDHGNSNSLSEDEDEEDESEDDEDSDLNNEHANLNGYRERQRRRNLEQHKKSKKKSKQAKALKKAKQHKRGKSKSKSRVKSNGGK